MHCECVIIYLLKQLSETLHPSSIAFHTMWTINFGLHHYQPTQWLLTHSTHLSQHVRTYMHIICFVCCFYLLFQLHIICFRLSGHKVAIKRIDWLIDWMIDWLIKISALLKTDIFNGVHMVNDAWVGKDRLCCRVVTVLPWIAEGPRFESWLSHLARVGML